MTDHTELKRLAKACGDFNWRFLTEKLTEYGIRDDHGYIAFLPVGHPAKYGACPVREAKAKFLGAMTPGAVLALLTENEALRRNAARYLVLRRSDLDTIHNGGLFAGLTPENIVVNGHELDVLVDAVIDSRKESLP